MAAKDLKYENISFVQYPVGNDSDYPGKVVADRESADALMGALKNDQPIVLTGGTGVGSVAPSDAPGGSDGGSAGSAGSGSGGNGSGGSGGDSGSSGGADSGSGGSTASSTPVELPDDVKGQTAATQTCSKGNN
jgi:hypothetical protein